MKLSGGEVIQLKLDYAVGLSFSTLAQLTVECTFEVVDGSRVIAVNPETTENTQETLSRLHRTAVELDARDDGTLKVVFDDGVWWLVKPHDSYEAWGYTDPKSEVRVVCGPGGRITTWGQIDT